MNRRTSLTAAAAAIALLLAGYGAFWWLVAERVEASLAGWVEAERQAGLIVDAERTPVGGFPLRFSATFRHPHVTGALSGQPIDWQPPDVTVWLWPFDLQTLHLSASGTHNLSLGGKAAVLDAEALEVGIGFDGAGRLKRVGLNSDAATLALPDGKTVAFDALTVAADIPPTPPSSERDPLLSFSLRAGGLKLPPDVQLLTTDPVGDVTLEGTMKGPLPGAPLRETLAAWRDHGGIVEISSFGASQGPLSLSGGATIALDAGLQPIVAANVKARGLGPTIDLLAGQKRIAQDDVLKLKLFVAATERDAQGGGKEVTSGVTLQNGFLSIGPFKVARIARIDWP